MGVELIGDKDPSRLWIDLDGLSEMSGEVSFRAPGSDAGSHDLSGGHLQIGDQTPGAMAAVFEFLAFDIPGVRRDPAAWAGMGGGAPELGCRSSHPYSSRACPPQQAPELPHRPGTLCRSARPVPRGRRVVE